MKTNLNEKEFEELEKTSLLLDILIDCEEYQKFDDLFKHLNCIQPDIIDRKDNPITKIKRAIEEIQTINSDNDRDCINIILISKYTRRLLREYDKEIERGKTKSKLFYKILNEALIKKMPLLSEDNQGRNKNNIQNKLRILSLNEISASSESSIAVGYADMALDELCELNRKWHIRKKDNDRIRHPYELYALYNKGLAFFHDHRDKDKAVQSLLQITSIFDKSSGNGFEEEYKTIHGINELYPIYFWLLYVPSKYLIVEDLSDSFSSDNLEKAIRRTIIIVKEKKSIIKLCDILLQGKDYTSIVEDYYLVKLGIKLIFSAIDKRDKECFSNFDEKMLNDDLSWLTVFSHIFKNVIDRYSEKLSRNNYLENHPNINSMLDSAKALFLLEYMRKAPKYQDEKVIDSFLKICERNLETASKSDWSGFACNYLEWVKFSLKRDIDINNKVGSVKKFNYYYKKIFNKIIDQEWIPRKKELVEIFLECQEKLLRRCKNENDNNNIYLKYQILFVNNVLCSDSERWFKKKWPQCEKERLVKNLKESMASQDIHNIPEWIIKHNIKNIEKFKEALQDEKYNAPQSSDLTRLSTFIKESVNCDFYTKKLRINTEMFNDHLVYKSCKPELKDCYGLTVLRRWQSFTPALSMGSEVGHKGGGYFVYKTDEKGEVQEGLVIDPGFDFLENFFEEGFSIKDINAVTPVPLTVE